MNRQRIAPKKFSDAQILARLFIEDQQITHESLLLFSNAIDIIQEKVKDQYSLIIPVIIPVMSQLTFTVK